MRIKRVIRDVSEPVLANFLINAIEKKWSDDKMIDHVLMVEYYYFILKWKLKKVNYPRVEYSFRKGFERSDGRFLKYFCEGENMFIEYGNKFFTKVLQDTFYCFNDYVGVPDLWWDNENFICLRYGCGSPCWGVKILPLNQKDTIEDFMYQYDFDDKKNLIVFFDYENDTPNITVRNLKTKQTQIIEFEECFHAGFVGHCIDSVSLKNQILYLKVRTNKESEKGMNVEGSKIIREKIKI